MSNIMDWLPCTQDPALDLQEGAGPSSPVLYQHQHQQPEQQQELHQVKQEEGQDEVVAELVCPLPDGSEQRHPLYAGLTLIGRKVPDLDLERRKWACPQTVRSLMNLLKLKADRELALEGPTVSAAHALLQWRPGTFSKRPQLAVMDLMSTYKTWIFTQPCSNTDNEYELQPGFMCTVPLGPHIRLQFGQLCCTVVYKLGQGYDGAGPLPLQPQPQPQQHGAHDAEVHKAAGHVRQFEASSLNAHRGSDPAAHAAAGRGSSDGGAGSTGALPAAAGTACPTPAHSATQQSPCIGNRQPSSVAPDGVADGSVPEPAQRQSVGVHGTGPAAGHSQSPGAAHRQPSMRQGGDQAASEQQGPYAGNASQHVHNANISQQQQDQQQQQQEEQQQQQGIDHHLCQSNHGGSVQPQVPLDNVRLYSQPTLSELARRQRAIDALDASDTEPSASVAVPSDRSRSSLGQPPHPLDHLHRVHHKSRLQGQQLQHTSSDEHHADELDREGNIRAGGQPQDAQQVQQQQQAAGVAVQQQEAVRAPLLRLPRLRSSGHGHPTWRTDLMQPPEMPAQQPSLPSAAPAPAMEAAAEPSVLPPAAAAAASMAADGTAPAADGGAPWWLSTPTEDVDGVSQEAAPSIQQPCQATRRQDGAQDELAQPDHQQTHHSVPMANPAAVPSTLMLQATEVQAAAGPAAGVHAVFKPCASPEPSQFSHQHDSESESEQESPPPAQNLQPLGRDIAAGAAGEQKEPQDASLSSPTAERRPSGQLLSLSRVLQAANGGSTRNGPQVPPSNPATPNLRGFTSLGGTTPASDTRPASGNQPWHVLSNVIAGARPWEPSPGQGLTSAAAFLARLASGSPPLARTGSAAAAAAALVQEPAGAVTNAAGLAHQGDTDVRQQQDDIDGALTGQHTEKESSQRHYQQQEQRQDHQKQGAAEGHIAVNRMLDMGRGMAEDGTDTSHHAPAGTVPAAGDPATDNGAGTLRPEQHSADGAQRAVAAVPTVAAMPVAAEAAEPAAEAGGEPSTAGGWNTRKRRARHNSNGSSVSGSSPAATAARSSGDGGGRSGHATPEPSTTSGAALPPLPVIKVEPLVVQAVIGAMVDTDADKQPQPANMPQQVAGDADAEGLMHNDAAPQGGPEEALEQQVPAVPAAAEVQHAGGGSGRGLSKPKLRPLLPTSGNTGGGWIGRSKRSSTPPKQLQQQHEESHMPAPQQAHAIDPLTHDPYAPPCSEPPPFLLLQPADQQPAAMTTAARQSGEGAELGTAVTPPEDADQANAAGPHPFPAQPITAGSIPMIAGSMSPGQLVHSILSSPDASLATSPAQALAAGAGPRPSADCAACVVEVDGAHSGADKQHNQRAMKDDDGHRRVVVSQGGVSQCHSALDLPCAPVSGGSLMSATQHSGLAFQQVGGLLNQLLGGPLPASGSDAAGPEHAPTALNSQQQAMNAATEGGAGVALAGAPSGKQQATALHGTTPAVAAAPAGSQQVTLSDPSGAIDISHQKGAAELQPTGHHPTGMPPRPPSCISKQPARPSASAHESPTQPGSLRTSSGRVDCLQAVADVDSPTVSLPGQMTQAAALWLTGMADQPPKIVSPSQGQGAALGLVQLHQEQQLYDDNEDVRAHQHTDGAADALGTTGTRTRGAAARGSKAKAKGAAAASGAAGRRGRGRARSQTGNGRGKGRSSRSRSTTPEPGAHTSPAHPLFDGSSAGLPEHDAAQPGLAGVGSGKAAVSKSRKRTRSAEPVHVHEHEDEPPVITGTQVLRSADALVATLHDLAAHGLPNLEDVDGSDVDRDQPDAPHDQLQLEAGVVAPEVHPGLRRQQSGAGRARDSGAMQLPFLPSKLDSDKDTVHQDEQQQQQQPADVPKPKECSQHVQQQQPRHEDGPLHPAAPMNIPTTSTTTTRTGSSVHIRHSRGGAVSVKEGASLHHQQQQATVIHGSHGTQQSPLLQQASEQQANGSQHHQQDKQSAQDPAAAAEGAHATSAAAGQLAQVLPAATMPSRRTKSVSKPPTAPSQLQTQEPQTQGQHAFEQHDTSGIERHGMGDDSTQPGADAAGAGPRGVVGRLPRGTRKAAGKAKQGRASARSSGAAMQLAVTQPPGDMVDAERGGGYASPSAHAADDIPHSPAAVLTSQQGGATPQHADDSTLVADPASGRKTPVGTSARQQTGSKRRRERSDSGAAADAAAELMASPVEQDAGMAAGTQTARKRQKGASLDGTQRQVHVRFSSMPKNDISKFKGIVQQLGGVLLGDKDPDTTLTHLVLPRDSFGRSIKQLVALAQGAVLVNPQWLEDSKREGRWVAVERQHLGADEATEQKFNFRLWDSWQKRKQDGPPLTGVHVYATKKVLEDAKSRVGGTDGMHPYQKLIQAAGGIWIDKPHRLATLLEEYSSDEFKAKVLVVGMEESKERRSGLPDGIDVYHKDVLLNSILRQQHVWRQDDTRPEFTVRSS